MFNSLRHSHAIFHPIRPAISLLPLVAVSVQQSERRATQACDFPFELNFLIRNDFRRYVFVSCILEIFTNKHTRIIKTVASSLRHCALKCLNSLCIFRYVFFRSYILPPVNLRAAMTRWASISKNSLLLRTRTSAKA